MKMHIKVFIYLCLVYCISNQVATETLETDYYCVESEAILECPKDSSIIIMGTLGRYSPSQCVDIESVNLFSKGSQPLDNCIGISRNDEFLNSICNGRSSCNALIQRKVHRFGHDGTTCDFESNMQKILYKCVPQKIQAEMKSFDICDQDGPDVITNIDKGYIHTPQYPDYYGNKRNCIISIQIPKGHTLNIFVISKSMEGLSIFSRKPLDFFIIDNEIEQYGFSDRPYLVYSGSDRDRVKIKFKSDLFTSSILQSPKGFLLYFEINGPITTSTTTTTTTTTTTATTSTSSFSTSIPKSAVTSTLNFGTTSAFAKLEHDRSISQKIKKEIELQEDNQVFTIIAVLVGIVGILVLIIFGLLFVFRRKQQKRKRAEEEIVYDEKYISSSNNYNEEYQNVSIVSTLSHQQLNKDTMKFGSTNTKKMCKSEPSGEKGSNNFNARLKNFYLNFNRTLHLSNQNILSNNKNQVNEKLNEFAKEKSEKLNLKDNKQTSLYNVNEFNPNDVAVKCEKDIPIDRLKLFRSSSRSLKSASTLNKKSNIELEREKKDASNKIENTYVSNPVIIEEKHKENNQDDTNNLNIYEVNFENNFAYLKPSLSISSTSISSSNKNNKIQSDIEKKATIEEDGVNIYQTIDDTDNQQEVKSISYSNMKKSSFDDSTSFNDTSLTDDPTKAILKQSRSNSCLIEKQNIDNIYSTPSNKRVVKSVPTSSTDPKIQGDKTDQDSMDLLKNSSIIHLLNDNENDETSA